MKLPEIFYVLNYLDKTQKRIALAVGGVAVAGMMVFVTGLPIFSMGGGQKVKDNWVVEQTLAETTVPARTAPPFVKGDQTKVVATYYSRGGQKTVWYLKKFSDADKAALEEAAKVSNPDRLAMKAIEKRALVRLPEAGSPWVPVDSDKGRQVTVLPVAPGVEHQPSFATVGD